MSDLRRSPVVAYGLAVLCVALAALVRLGLDPWLGFAFPFATFFFAVLVAAWFGGFGPALVATLVGLIASVWFLLPPRGTLTLTHAADQAGLLLYMGVGFGIAILGGLMRRSRLSAEALAADEARQREELKITLESIGDGVVVTDTAGRVSSLNAVAEALTGWSSAEARGRPLHEIFRIVNEHSRKAVENPVDRVLREGVVVGLANHTVLIAKDGTERPIDDSAAPIRNAAGDIVGVVLVFRDVSDRKRAEDAARQLAAIVESSNDAIIGKDPDGIITSWNPGAERLYGYKAAEIVGKSFDVVVPPDRALEVRESVDRIRAGGRVGHLETVRRRKDGSLLEVSVSYSPIHDADGRVVGTSVVARDISARLRAEEAVREEGRVTEALYRVGTVLAAELDLGRIVQTVTEESTALTGAQFGAFFYNAIDPAGERYTLYSIAGVPRERFERFPMPRNTAIFEPTFRGAGPVRIDDVTKDPRYGRNPPHSGMPEGHLPVRGYLAVPVVSRSGEVIGGLFFGHEKAGVFTERHERLAAAVAAQAAVAIDNSRLYAQLRESQTRLAAVIDNSPAVIFLKDGQGRYLLINRGYEEMARKLGLEGPYLGKTDFELLPAEVAQRFAKDDREVMESGRVHIYEETVGAGDGARTTLTTKFPLFDDAGKTTAVCGIALDITDRVQAERAVRESEERLRLALAAGRMGVWDWNVRTNEVRWSDNLEAIHGLPTGGFDGSLEAFQRLVHPADRDSVNAAIGRALQERSDYDIEFRNLWPDGSVHWMSGKGKVFTEAGEPARMLGVAMDVTERKRAQRDTQFLADASAALAAIVDYGSTLQKVAALAVPDFADWCAVDMLNEDGELKRVAVAHVDAAKVKLAHELHGCFPPDLHAPAGVWNILRTGRSELTSDITDRMLTESIQDPELLRIIRELGLRSYMGVPLSMRGRTLGVLTFIAAESGRRYTAETLAVAEDLAHRAAVAIENARLYQALREADRRKDEFLALLGHELRNPLAPISNALYILKMPGADAAVATRAREMMQRQVEHMVRLVDDLLDVSRILRGKIELRREPLDLSLVVARAVETSQPFIDAEGHRLTVANSPEPLPVHGDLVRLSQVVSNLLNNAAKYSERGGRIELATAREDGQAVLRVRDTGIGIAPELLPKLFDMFFQGSRRTRKSQGGLGIGLSLVKGLVEMHGGRVEARSEGPGRGSEFVVRLPLITEFGVRDAESKPGLDSAFRVPDYAFGKKVLVVDDNVDAAESLAALLEMNGQRVAVAFDGETALAKAKADPPQLAILDLGMPGMDGFELARAFRADPALRGVRLVAMTGWGQAEDRQRSKEAGFDGHLVKPADAETLEKLLSD